MRATEMPLPQKGGAPLGDVPAVRGGLAAGLPSLRGAACLTH